MFISFSHIKTVLITGAKSPAALEWVRRLGSTHTVYVADSLKQPLARGSQFVKDYWQHPSASRYPHDFAAFLERYTRNYAVDLIIPTCEEVFYLGRFQDQFPCPVFCPPFDLLKTVHSKMEVMSVAEGCGISTPKTHLIRSVTEKKAFEPQRHHLVFKPEYSRFASDVLICPSVPAFDAFTPTPERPWVVQDYIPGKEFCSYSIAVYGCVTAHACYHPLYRAGKGSGMYFQPVDHPSILEFVRTFVAKTMWTGQVAFDFIETPEGAVFMLECNPRATSGIHLVPEQQRGNALFNPSDFLNTPCRDPKMSAVAMMLYGGKYWKKPLTFFKDMTSATDIIWDTQDKGPFWQQFMALGEIISISFKTGQSLIRIATQDGEWNGQKL